MKKIIFILILLFCKGTFAQQKSTYDSLGILPHFTFYTLSGNAFTSDSLDENKKTVLIYFHTTCEFCQDEITSIEKKMDQYKNVQFILLSHESLKDLNAFISTYHIDQFPQIMVLHDKEWLYYRYYHTQLTPTVHIYFQKKLLFMADGETKDGEIDPYLQ